MRKPLVSLAVAVQLVAVPFLLTGCTVCIGKCRLTLPKASTAEKAGALAGSLFDELFTKKAGAK